MTNSKIKLILPGCLIAASGYFLIYALLAIYNFGLHTLFADQWRIYTDYFNKPFPLNIFTTQNGHHPVIAGLFFLLDIKFFRGTQTFLLILGTSLALVTALGILWPTIRSRSITSFHKSAAIYIVFSGMFWLGNHRILLHANESVHAYLVTVFLVAAISALVNCRFSGKEQVLSPWCLIACLLSQCAVLSFGSGVAVPPTLLTLALLMRFPGRQVLMLTANIMVTVIIYLVLPGASDVVMVLASTGHHLQKLINIFTLAGAPPAFLFSPQFSFEQTAGWIRNYLCPIAGGGCLLWLGIRLIMFKRKRAQSVVVYNIAGLVIFSWITIVLIAVMRANFFTFFPQQVFANRYLLWSNFLWISLGLMLLNDIYSCSDKRLKLIGLCCLLAVFVFVGFWIQHNNKKKMPALETWSNSIRLAAASLIVGAHDDQLIRQRLREPLPEVYALTRKLKTRKLNIFAAPLAQVMGKNINSIYELGNKIFRGGLHIDDIFHNGPNRNLSARFSGWIRSRNEVNIEGVLVTKTNGLIVGYAVMLSHRFHSNKRFRLSYSGYIKDYVPAERYRLYGITGAKMRAIKRLISPAAKSRARNERRFLLPE